MNTIPKLCLVVLFFSINNILFITEGKYETFHVLSMFPLLFYSSQTQEQLWRKHYYFLIIFWKICFIPENFQFNLLSEGEN